MSNPPQTILADLNGVKITQARSERFWSCVSKGDGCWLWQGRARRGYGKIRFYSKGRIVELGANRLAFALTSGPIREGLFVCHSCDVPLCCNPAHLFLGTLQANCADMMRKGRSCKGVNKPFCKLTEDQVRSIRVRHAEGRWPTVLANEYGVGPSTIKKIVKRKAWKHIL